MRRFIAGSSAFLALTGTLLVLPVYAAPLPDASPVTTSIDEVSLGSVVEPEGDAVVTQDGAVQPDGVSEAEASATPTDAPASETPAAPTTTPEPTPSQPPSSPTATEATAVPAAEDVASSGAELPGVPALTVSQPDTDSFETVGVTWRQDPSVVDVVVQLRVESTDGTWGEWTTLEADDIEQAGADGEEARGGTAPYWTGAASGVEVVVQGVGGAVPEDVRLALLDPGDSPADALPVGEDVQDQAHAATAMPRIYSRAEWGADESIRTWNPEYVSTIKAATVHHTADSNGYAAADVPAIMRSIYAYHTRTRGWGDIGYNVVVDKFGRAFEGRYGGLNSTVVGAHAGGFNSYTFGVSMLGNYDVAPVPEVTVDAVADVIAWKFGLFGVDPAGSTSLTSGGGGTARYAAGTRVTLPTIFGHRDVGSTSCPGQYGYARMGDIRSKVAARMAASSNPQGAFDSISVEGQWVTVRGWATDPDTAGAVTMHVYADGANVVAVTAADRTADGVDGAHAYVASFPLVFGTHTVCVYALNVGPGTTNPHLGCRSVVVDPTSFNPRGGLDELTAQGRDVRVTGWATDPDARGAVSVHVYVDGSPLWAVAADRPTATRGQHGYETTVRLADGPHTVCTYAINSGLGTTNVQLGCRSITVSMAPVGALESVTANGRQVTISGWASDPDTPSGPVQVHVYVDGWGIAVLNAAQAAHGGHGYSLTLPLSAGVRSVCTYGINVGAGSSNTHLGCRTVEVSSNPVGSLTGVTAERATARVTGWSVDPDAPTSAVTVHLYVDGAPVAAVAADRTGPGVAGAHAFDVALPLRTPGAHSVCAYAINIGEGTTNPHLGCRSITVAATAFDPTGALDTLSLSGPVARIAGAAGDPDATAALQVHVYVDGVGRAILLADGTSTAQGRRFGGDIPLTTGEHTVCAYAINQGHGTTNTHLGCRDIEVAAAAWNPVGALTSATASGGQVTVGGWASDPDAPAAAVTVHVYVDGVGAAILTADQSEAGVNGAHAYRGQLALRAGSHQVCTYAINTGQGTTNPHLGCRTVVV